jgi:hypothetical protein
MKFKYKRLGSGVERPIIPITVRNPSTKQSIGYFALVDSGSDICIFASEIAELIGLDVTAGRQVMVGGVVQGESRPYYLHEVDIEVGGSPRRATVGFMPELSKNGHGLLGRDGFFDRFTFVKFEQPKSTVEVGAQN